MVTPTQIATQTLLKVRQAVSADPLLRPLARVPDSTIDAALAARGMRRANLFLRRGGNLAPHRHRLAEMLTVFHFSPSDIVARHWRELKQADHDCARCADPGRCERWLRRRGDDDAPRRFCPNVTTFERWRRDYLERDAAGGMAEGGRVLEAGLEETRRMLQHLHLQRPLAPRDFIASPHPAASRREDELCG